MSAATEMVSTTPTGLSGPEADRVLDAIMDHGIFIDVEFHTGTMSVMTDPRDLGLRPEQIPKHMMSMGRKKLFDPEWLTPMVNIQSAARRNLEAISRSWPKSRMRFVPDNKLEQAILMLQDAQTRFYEAVSNFIVNIEAAKTQAREMWREAFAEEVKLNPEQIEAAMQRIEEAFPNADQIRRAYEFDWTTMEIRAPRGVHMRIVNLRQREMASARVEEAVRQHVVELRAGVAELASRVLEGMKGKPELGTRTANAVKRELEKVRELNWTGDAETNRLIDEIAEGMENPLTDTRAVMRNVVELSAANIDRAVSESIASLLKGEHRAMEV